MPTNPLPFGLNGIPNGTSYAGVNRHIVPVGAPLNRGKKFMNKWGCANVNKQDTIKAEAWAEARAKLLTPNKVFSAFGVCPFKGTQELV